MSVGATANMIKFRKTRVAHFRKRVAYAPEEVYHHATGGWPYIPVHHFADETDTPVYTADCWCFLGADVALLECSVSGQCSREIGLYARIDGNSPFWPKLHAVLPAPLTRAAVEEAMKQFMERGFPDPLISILMPDGPLVKLPA